MNTVKDVAESVIAATNSDAGLELARRWIDERYKELVSAVRFKHLRQYGTVVYPAPLNTGTFAIPYQSAQAVGTGTAFTNAQLNWFIRFDIIWHRIIAINPATQTLTLDPPYLNPSGATASAFTALQRWIPLDPSVRFVGDIAHPRRRKRLKFVSMSYLDASYPSRQLQGPFPWCWAEAPRQFGENYKNPNRGKMIEVYPPSNISEAYTYTFWPVPPALKLGDELPPELDAYQLREGALIDHYRYEAERFMHMKQPNVEAAGFYANLQARQTTIWKDKIQLAVVADQLAEDMTLEIDDYQYYEMNDFDITTARDQVYSQWPR